MVEKSNQNVFIIQKDASSFAEFEISEFEISRVDCTSFHWNISYISVCSPQCRATTLSRWHHWWKVCAKSMGSGTGASPYSQPLQMLSSKYSKCNYLNTVAYSRDVLFISYKFVKGFLAITFVFPVFSNWNFHDVLQRLLYDQEQNFSWIRQKTKIFPIDPHYKNRTLL